MGPGKENQEESYNYELADAAHKIVNKAGRC
jgi:hypothetical protein